MGWSWTPSRDKVHQPRRSTRRVDRDLVIDPAKAELQREVLFLQYRRREALWLAVLGGSFSAAAASMVAVVLGTVPVPPGVSVAVAASSVVIIAVRRLAWWERRFVAKAVKLQDRVETLKRGSS